MPNVNTTTKIYSIKSDLQGSQEPIWNHMAAI